jgi:death-on-curing protein
VPCRDREPIWVDRQVVETIHLDLLRSHGGLSGLRDENALESALARRRNRCVYGWNRDLATLAATYAFGLAHKHPWRNGKVERSHRSDE